MSIYDKASLVLIPSGTKTSKVYSQKPVNGDGDFTFSRSTAATRVNADGNIEKETQNLLTYSNTFDNAAWVGTNRGLTSGQSGYDGGSDAWLLTKTGAFGRIQQNLSYSGVVTISVYAKANASNYMRFYADGNGANIYFDLVNGNVSSGNDYIDANVEDIGSGWYRCSAAFAGGGTSFRIYPSDNADTSGTSGSIYIQDAQVEQGLVARDYIETTTAAVEGGITDNVPRLDYTDSSCPALLLEPQRTNRVTNSEYINGDWSANRSTLIVNDDTSPEGVNNATKLQEDTTASNTHFTGKGYNYVSGTTYSWSVYVKPDGRDEVLIQQGNPAVISFNAVFNFTSETANNIGNGTARIEDAGNGWYRCIIEGTTALLSSGTNINVFLRSGGTTTYTGNGASGVLLYGFQLEEGSYATSYIPTYGTSVTRNKEDCSLTDVSSIISNAKGSFYIEGTLSTSDTSGVIVLTAGANTQDLFYIFITTAGVLLCEWFDGGTLQARLQAPAGSISVGDSFKIAAAYQDNDFVAYWNGTQIGTDSSGTAPTPTLLRIGKYNVDNYTGGSYTNVMVFPTRLSNEELADLTT